MGTFCAAQTFLPGTNWLSSSGISRGLLRLTHREHVLAFEREHGLAHVAVDEPQGFAGSIPPVWEVTCPELAIVRLHGRNRETWDKKGLASSVERFNYLYSEAEFLELAEPVRRLGAKSGRVHVFFNNNYSNHAQRNTAEFRRLID